MESQLGPKYTRVTRAYAEGALSTGGICQNTKWEALNYTMMYSPEPDYVAATEAACSKPYQHYSKGEVTDASFELAGDPLLSMPPDLSLIDPLWSTCTAETLGGYDPPRALTAAAALAPATTTIPDPWTQAQPAFTPTHSLPVQTPAPQPGISGEGESSAGESVLDPSRPSADQVSRVEEASPPPSPSESAPKPGDQGQVGDPAMPSPPHNTGYKNPQGSNLKQENDFPNEGPLQISGPGGQHKENAPVAGGSRQDPGSDPNSITDSDQGSDIQGKGPPVVGPDKADSPEETSMVFGTHTIVVDSSGVSFDGIPLEAEESPVRVSGAAALVQGGSVIVGDAIIYLSSLAPSAATDPTVIAWLTMTPLVGAIAIDGETLHAGESPRTVAGTLLSFDNRQNLIVDPTVRVLPTTTPTPPPVGTLLGEGQTADINGQVCKVLSNGISIASTTLTPGAPAVAISGTRISLGRTALTIGGSTIPISFAEWNTFTTTIGGQIITAVPSSLVLAGTSLAPGAPGVTIDNELISLNEAGSLILGSSTVALSNTPLTSRIGDELITAAPTGVQIPGATLLPAAAGWTIDGTRISLNTMGGVIVGEETIAPSGHNTGIGALILEGIGSKAAVASTSASSSRASVSAGTRAEVFEGRALRPEVTDYWGAVATVIVMVLC